MSAQPPRRRDAFLRAACALAVSASVAAAAGEVLGQQRTRQAITGPVTREAIVRSLSIVPDRESTDGRESPGRVEASVMLNIEFGFDSAELTGRARRDLDRVAEALADRRLGNAPVTIEGHTDATGDEAYNRRLSRRRATAVVTYLTQQGVAGSRLTGIGLGEDRLLREYDPADGRQRRVEIVRSW